MPDYPEYDSQHRAEYATEIRKIVDTYGIKRDTETGKHIYDWAPDGNWLDKAIEYFSPKIEERKNNLELYNTKLSIRNSLETLKSSYEGLAEFNDPVNEPEKAAEKWDKIMFNIDSAKNLQETLLKFNELTKNSYISEPAVQAAAGAGHTLAHLNAALVQYEKNNRMRAFRSYPETVEQRKADQKNRMDRHKINCDKKAVNATCTEDYMKAAGSKCRELEEQSKEYESLLSGLDREAENETRNLTDATAEFNAKIQLTKMEIAYQQYRTAETMSKFMEEELLVLLEDLPANESDGAGAADMEKDIREKEEELNNLRHIHKAQKEEYERIKTDFDKLPSKAKKNLNTDFSFSISTSKDRLDELQEQLNAQNRELAGLKPEETELTEARKALSDKLKNTVSMINEKRNKINSEFYQPAIDLHFDSIQVETNMLNIINTTGKMCEQARDMKNNDPRPAARDKMQSFLEQLNKNKRLLHRDSAEFKALKDVVGRFADNDKNVSLRDISNAARDYLNKKESQRFSTNSAMRNYRKTVAAMILDYAFIADNKLGFLANNAKELKNISATLKQIQKDDSILDGENIEFQTYLGKPRNEREEMFNNYKNNLNKETESLAGPVNEVNDLISKYAQLKEKSVMSLSKGPDAVQDSVHRHIDEPVKENEVALHI